MPVFAFARRFGPGLSALGGALWISLVTLLSQSWLAAFHPLALPLVLLFQVPWYAAVFAAASWAGRRASSLVPWVLALLWTVFEFLRVQGFFAYPYTSLASTFWAYPVTFQSADLGGTLPLTFLLAWTAAWLAWLPGRGRGPVRRDLALGLGLWALNLGYGLLRLAEPEPGALWRPALIQQAQDPWRGGATAYAEGFDKLRQLSDQALAAGPDAVVWSETAFVPSVAYHTRYHDNPDSLRLVRRLEQYLAGTRVPFVLGNDHREKTDEGTLADYNAVLVWDGGWTGRYEKSRLVPFTESFPYAQALPLVYRWLLEADTHFWMTGRQTGVLRVGSVTVGTPVCFEDAFADTSRRLAGQGAQVLINLTNDSWAPGRASRMQHLSLAVFRAVETRLPLLRAANDGATAAFSARGELRALLPLGQPGMLPTEVRLGSGAPTPAVLAGDLPGWTLALLLLLLAGLGLRPRRPALVDKPGQL